MQAGLEHVSLNADLALSGDDAARRHAPAEIAPFLDRNFARADVDEDAPQNQQQDDQQYEPDD